MKNRLYLWLLVLTLILSLAGCGSAKSEASSPSMAAMAQDQASMDFGESKSNTDMAMGGVNGEVQVTSAEAGGNASVEKVVSKGQTSAGQNTGIANVNQKIIFTGQVDFETLEFDKTRNDLSQYMASIGAYQQSSSVKGGGIGYQGLRNAQYVFRVPKSKYDQSFIDIRKFGTVVFEQSNGQDVTDQYFDTEARLKSLKIQQERLLELLKKAVKMEDILKIEKELQTTNYEIENLTGTLKKWDSLVEYSTLTVNINEVVKIKPVQPKENDGLFHRISSGFTNSAEGLWNFLQDAIVVIVASIPVLLPLAVIAYVLYRIVRRRVKKPEQPSKPLVIPDISDKNEKMDNNKENES